MTIHFLTFAVLRKCRKASICPILRSLMTEFFLGKPCSILTWFPRFVVMGCTPCSMPDKLPAAIICIRILIITNTIAFLNIKHIETSTNLPAWKLRRVGYFPPLPLNDVLWGVCKTGYPVSSRRSFSRLSCGRIKDRTGQMIISVMPGIETEIRGNGVSALKTVFPSPVGLDLN